MGRSTKMRRQCRQWWARVVAAWPFVTKYRMLREIAVAKDREADRVTAQWRASAWEVERQKAEPIFRKLIAIEREPPNEADVVYLRLKFSPLRLAVVSPWSTKLSVGKGSVEIRSFAHDRASNNVLGDYGSFRLAGASHRTQYVLDHSLLERLYPNVLQQWLEFIR